MLQIATLQERFYLQNNTYTTDMTNLGFAAAANNLTDSGTYICSVPVANANTFNAVATYQNADAEAGKCLTFTIDGRAQKGSAPAPTAGRIRDSDRQLCYVITKKADPVGSAFFLCAAACLQAGHCAGWCNFRPRCPLSRTETARR